jgi:hypothetical protein
MTRCFTALLILGLLSFLPLGCSGSIQSNWNADSGSDDAFDGNGGSDDGSLDGGQDADAGGDPDADAGGDPGADAGGDPDADAGGDPDADGGQDGNDGGGDQNPSGPIIANHSVVAAFSSIPESLFATVRANTRIFYGHTSHGSQIVTGLGMLADENATRYQMPTFHEISSDLQSEGYIGWVQPTRDFLDDNSNYHYAMWSWCGGMGWNTDEGIDIYLNAMNELEQDYPNVKFIYMTGHTDGSGQNGLLRTNNARIRAYCQQHNKILFDFEDIESWDPGGTYYPDTTDACGWCVTWCGTHSCPSCDGACAHSECFNCYLKGKAFWWLLARTNGWNGQ